MLMPIIACVDPYTTARAYESAGWNIDFSQPTESGDPLVGVSLFGSRVLLGVTEGYVKKDDLLHIACGVEFYVTVPRKELENVREKHGAFSPTPIRNMPWGVFAFEVSIENHSYMIAGEG